MTVYLSGKITGKPNYQDDFIVWSSRLERDGHKTINPCYMPEGLTPADYMRVSLAQIEAADAVLMLPDWEYSKGAVIEKLYAEYIGKKILYAGYEDWPSEHPNGQCAQIAVIRQMEAPNGNRH
jgi:hypothetical protein